MGYNRAPEKTLSVNIQVLEPQICPLAFHCVCENCTLKSIVRSVNTP